MVKKNAKSTKYKKTNKQLKDNLFKNDYVQQAKKNMSKKLEMGALVEVHTAEELDRALSVGAEMIEMIGINNRNLKTFSVHIETTEKLAAAMPKGILCVSESGIKNHGDMKRLAKAGVNAVLVGTTLMKAPDIGAKVKELLLGKGKG